MGTSVFRLLYNCLNIFGNVFSSFHPSQQLVNQLSVSSVLFQAAMLSSLVEGIQMKRLFTVFALLEKKCGNKILMWKFKLKWEWKNACVQQWKVKSLAVRCRITPSSGWDLSRPKSVQLMLKKKRDKMICKS